MNVQQLNDLDDEKLRNAIKHFSKKHYGQEVETLNDLHTLSCCAEDNFEQVTERLIKEIENNEL